MAARGRECPPGCRGKRTYRTRWQAERVARRLQRKDGDKMTWYRCSFGGYHVGHVYPHEGKRRAELKKVAHRKKHRANISVGQPEPSIRERETRHGKRKQHRHGHEHECRDEYERLGD